MTPKRFNKLLKNIKSNAKAFTELYEFYFPKIVMFIHFKYGNMTLGEDVAQDFFLKQYQYMAKTLIENPTAWVYTCCDNMAKDNLKKYSKYDALCTVENKGVEDKGFNKIVFGDYMDKLNSIDPIAKEIIVQHIYWGYDFKEIAANLNLTYDNVRQKYSRGLKKLRKYEK